MRSRPHTIDNRQIDPKRASKSAVGPDRSSPWIRFLVPREEQNSSEAHLTVKKLFVAGLREGISEEHLQQHFSRYGNVMEVLIMKDRDGSFKDSLTTDGELPFLGKPRGFAFVTFDDYDAVDKAVLEKPHMVNGRPLDVKKAVPKEKMQDDSGGGPNAGGMSSYNRSNSSNYSGGNGGSLGPPPSSSRNNYGSMRDNYNSGGGSWDNQGGMPRMNNPNSNYNQSQPSPYDQQGGYNANASAYNSSMAQSSMYSQSYNPMGQSQPVPPPPQPSSLPQQQQQPAMMNYDMYNNTSSMSYNANPNPSAASSYMQPPVSSYGQSQQQSYGSNSNSYGNMSNPFNLPQQPAASASTGGYSSVPSASTPYDTSSSYGITAQNYGGNGGGGYGSMAAQQSRGGGPMRGGRG